jgi:cytochrome c oxidase subunit 2
MTGLLTILIIVLAVLALAQIVRVFELSSEIRKEDAVASQQRDNDINGKLLLVFLFLMLGSFVWMTIHWWDVMLPKPGSAHGEDIDSLMNLTMLVIIAVFFVTQPLIFYFGYKYRGLKGNRAEYLEHNNKLEFIWTIIPAVVLAGIILYGLTTWINIMDPENSEEPIVVELYAKQFGWNARLAGEDNKLGFANVNFIKGVNILGVDPDDVNSLDDRVTTELYLPVGKPVKLKFRAQDVIHSAYMPHFRVQMNCVPGAVTQFQFTPTVTTAQMRQDPGVIKRVDNINSLRTAKGEEPYEFDYVLLCNKICGSAHYNMQMKIVVVEESEYNDWLKKQTTFAEAI